MEYTAVRKSPAPSADAFYTAATPDASASYRIAEIEKPTKAMLDQFMALHEHVIKTLPAGGKHWVKPRTRSNVRAHILNGHVCLGVFDKTGTMVGQVLLTLPDLPGGKNLKGYPIGYKDGMLRPDHCMVVQTLGVHPAHAGRGIRAMILEKAEEIAYDKWRRHLLAKTDVLNKGSVRGFIRAGYMTSQETSVLGEAYKCVFMWRPLKDLHTRDLTQLKKLNFQALTA
jgi:GNAT superfamily N-acetyltransferase